MVFDFRGPNLESRFNKYYIFIICNDVKLFFHMKIHLILGSIWKYLKIS